MQEMHVTVWVSTSVTTTIVHHRALRVPLLYIRFVERSVSVPIAGTTSEPAFPIFALLIKVGFGTAGGNAMVGTIDEANGMGTGTLEVGGCAGSASR